MESTTKGFEALNLSEQICRAIRGEKYDSPTPIQHQAIPHLLEGRDLLGCAQTGTGKTAAFGIPLVNFLLKTKKDTALVMTPTRE